MKVTMMIKKQNKSKDLQEGIKINKLKLPYSFRKRETKESKSNKQLSVNKISNKNINQHK